MRWFVIPGKYRNLARIGEIVASVGKEAGLTPSSIYSLQLALDEASSNIIEHSYRGEGVGDIRLGYRVAEDEIVFVLQDQGVAFNPLDLPEPDFSVPLEELPGRGAGVMLMRKMVDEIRYQHTPNEGNELIIVKRIHPDELESTPGREPSK
jgi:serine/threonine-protein kinase RsbW